MSEESDWNGEAGAGPGSDERAPRTVHDALFKRVFSLPGHAAGVLRAALPARVVQHID